MRTDSGRLSDVSLVERFGLLLCDWLFVSLGVSGRLDLTALHILTAERKEADFNCTSLTVSHSPLDHFHH